MEKGENIAKLGNILGTHWEREGTWCKHIGKLGKMKKNPPAPTPKHKRKKNKAPFPRPSFLKTIRYITHDTMTLVKTIRVP
jgi:hypothetical protein